VRDHQQRGDRVVVLSSSVPYLVDPVCRELGIEERICTELDAINDRFTGKFKGRLCFGADKVDRVAEYVAEHGIDMEGSWFYSDSITDLPMLLAVRHPVAVNPDRPLRRYALRHGWQILNFSHAAGRSLRTGSR
jgi:HAD superfamily hydrolase (TIGR01490 family)